jgi:hypothetical protein
LEKPKRAQPQSDVTTPKSPGKRRADAPTRKTKKQFPCEIKVLEEPEHATIELSFFSAIPGSFKLTVSLHSIIFIRVERMIQQYYYNSWPEALLPTKIPQARVISYVYVANSPKWPDALQVWRIREHSQTFLRELANYRHLGDTV